MEIKRNVQLLEKGISYQLLSLLANTQTVAESEV